MSTWNDVYPRPQLRRASFWPLTDSWTLNDQPIRMPFPPQSPLNGFQGDVPETLLYQTIFTVPEDFCPDGRRIRLHFGAVDQTADVFINGRPAAHHEGGYLPFFADVTDLLVPGENRLNVLAMDSLSHDYPYGKQRIRRGGMWYTPVSGIWQTVWLEAVPLHPVESLTIVPDLTGITLTVDSRAAQCDAIIRFDGTEVLRSSFPLDGKPHRIDIPSEHIHLWTTDAPHLYHMTVTAGNDTVETYFALRTVTIEPDKTGIPRLCLNGVPTLMNGVLDQGYYPDGVFLPEDPEEIVRDVQRMKALGFNMLRKHIKVEHPSFYAACDRLGMLVVQDMVNNGGYNYLLDTVLPTIGFQRRPNWPVSRRRKDIFLAHSADTIRHLRNHPCIVAWTIFNEGWGQHDGDRICRALKSLDPTRLFDTASGWFKVRETDFDSRHVYFRNKRLKSNGKPLFLSECGGYARRIAEHVWNPSGRYGYGKTDTEEQLTDVIVAMYREMVIPAIPSGLCGVAYTQLTDVEDEINGLYTYDRTVRKVDGERLRAILDEANRVLRGSTK